MTNCRGRCREEMRDPRDESGLAKGSEARVWGRRRTLDQCLRHPWRRRRQWERRPATTASVGLSAVIGPHSRRRLQRRRPWGSGVQWPQTHATNDQQHPMASARVAHKQLARHQLKARCAQLASFPSSKPSPGVNGYATYASRAQVPKPWCLGAARATWPCVSVAGRNPHRRRRSQPLRTKHCSRICSGAILAQPSQPVET